MNNWLKQETDKLVNFIETASDAELDKALEEVKFGSLVNEKSPEQEAFIQAILKDESWHKPYYWSTGRKPKDANFYVQGNRVYSNFTNSEGRAMRFYFYFCSPPEFNPYLICGAEFI